MPDPAKKSFKIELGGLNTEAPAALLYPDAATCTNVRWGPLGQLMKRYGFTPYNSTAMPTVNVCTGLFKFNRRDTTTRYTIACTKANIYVVPTSGAWTTLASGLTATDTDFWDATVFNNELILVNGVDAPQVTDGTAAGTTALVTQASTQTRTAMTTAQSLTAGLHNVSPGVLIAPGGASSAGSFDGITQKNDTIGDTWTTKTRANINRDEAAGFTTYGKAYVVGGNVTGPALTATAESYSPVTDSWVQITNVTAARRQQGGAAVNNMGFIQTGNDSAGAAGWTTANYRYDPAVDTWSTQAVISSTARRQSEAFSLSNITHIVSGRTTAGPDNQVTTHDEYNPFSNAWTSLAAITAYRRNAASASGKNNLGYVAGGEDSVPAEVTTIYSYNRVTNAWATVAATLGTARQIPGGASDDWWLYVAGGLIGANASAITERLSLSPAAPVARYIESVKGYLIMARTSSFPSRLFYSTVGNSRIWDPNAWIDVNPDDGDWITGMFVFAGRLYVSKTDRIFEIAFSVLDPVDGDHEIIPLDNVPGTTSNRSIVVTDHGVYYLAEDGFRRFDGSSSKEVGNKVKGYMSILTSESRNKYVSAVWVKANYEIWFSVATTASPSYAANLLVYNYRYEKWSIWNNASFLSNRLAESIAVIENANDAEQIVFGTSHATDGLIYQANVSTSVTDNGVAITTLYRSGWFSPITAIPQFRPEALYLWGLRAASATLTVRTRGAYGGANLTTDAVIMDSGASNQWFEDGTDQRFRILLGGGSVDLSRHVHQIDFSESGTASGSTWEIYGAVMVGMESTAGGGFPTL